MKGFGAFFMLLIVIGLVAEFWWWILAAVGILVLGPTLLSSLAWYRAHRSTWRSTV